MFLWYNLCMNNIVANNPFVIIFVVGTVLRFFIKHFLEFIDYRARVKNGGTLPGELKDISAAQVFDTKKLSEISAYENAKYFYWIPVSVCNLILALVLVCSGFYPAIFNIICRITDFPHDFISTYFCALLFFILASVPESILSIPFDLIHEFVLEKKFGFSKMTLRLWIIDQLKGFVMNIVLSAILIAAMTGVLVIFPHRWWIFLTALLFAFTLVMQVLYPLVIAPMFNKFSPLEDGELKTRITKLMENLGFKSSGIFIMDASKRSGHSNAYFGGIGKAKRVVLYDTLVSQLNVDELEAVLGHELGHFKLKHIIKRFCVMIPVEFILMYILNKVALSTSIYTGFGFAFAEIPLESVQFIGLFLSAMVAGPLLELFAPVSNFSSRRDEYQADAFSAKLTKNPDALISGLVKLNCENLSELLPPKLYVMWNYNHPTLVERIKALKKIKL